tara:strand:- start:48 stop:635 length:588 start_codon:yes stop_codon:yes gene_type:complete
MGKVCTTCKIEKDFKEFYKHNAATDGLDSSCKPCRLEWRKEHRQKNKEYYSAMDKRNYEKDKSADNLWWKRNLDKMNDYNKKRYKENPEYFLIRGLLRSTLDRLNRSKSAKTIELMGYSADELGKYLSALNENWRDYEIDHKIPVSWFKKNTPPHIINDFRNLQLLTKEENTRKGNRYADDVPADYQKIVESFLK